MGLDRDAFKLHMWFRNSIGIAAFAELQLKSNYGIDMLYHTKSVSLEMACEIYVERGACVGI